MEFRWIALIALWTLIAGPMFDAPVGQSRTTQSQTTASTVRPAR